jgi:hypothetical protein
MSTINYENQLAAEEAKQEAARKENESRAAFDELCNLYTLRATEANFVLFKAWAYPLTFAAGEHLIKNKVQGFTPDLTSREELIQELLEAYPQGERRNWGIRMSTWSLRQLRQEKRDQQLRASLKTGQQAKEYLAGVRKAGQTGYFDKNGVQWPRLLKTIVPRGEIQARDTREYLLHLARTDAWTFKNRFVLIYGNEQVDAYLQGRM